MTIIVADQQSLIKHPVSVWESILLVFFIFQQYKCLYVLVCMSLLWMMRPIPLAVSSVFPIVAFPILGIFDTATTCTYYFNVSIEQSRFLFLNCERQTLYRLFIPVCCTKRKIIGNHYFVYESRSTPFFLFHYWFLQAQVHITSKTGFLLLLGKPVLCTPLLSQRSFNSSTSVVARKDSKGSRKNIFRPEMGTVVW